MKPRLFIGSSSESVSIAYASQQNLHHDAEVTVWDQGVFELSTSALESLIKTLDESDFAMFVFSPNDLVTIRGNENQAVRDNVIFELGLFVGRLGRNRCFILIPEDHTGLRIPTDLIGMTPATYETGRSDGSFQAATAPACHSIREAIGRTGPRSEEPGTPSTVPKPPEATSEEMAVQVEESEASEKELSEREPKDYEWVDAYIGKDYERSLGLLEAEISSTADTQDLALLESWAANVQYRMDSKLGIQRFEDVLTKHPNSYHPYFVLGLAKMEQNLHQDCLSLIERGLSKVTDKPPLIRIKASCLRQMGLDEDAIAALREGVTEFPQDASLREKLADDYIERKEYAAARVCLEEGLSVIPNNRLLLSKYAKLLYDHIDKRLALIPYDQLIDLFPEDPRYLTLRANIYLELDLNDLAMRDYKRADELAERRQSWITANIGNLYKNRGFFHEGIDYLERALQTDPKYQYAHERLAASIKLRDEQLEKLSGIVREAKREILVSRLAPGDGEVYTDECEQTESTS
ncbi:nucleotide-binding protein [Candidatus Bipolaricaulota bacterium]|nr:nucleotide-binding protein [Candidatus Bipolaricaulota bacterium]